MDDALDRFFATLPADLRRRLDYSPGSLDSLEAWLLARYRDTGDMLDRRESTVVDGLARYIGETFRKAIGGHWDIELDNPKDVYYGLPQLTGFGPRATPECPSSLATAAANRRTGKYLSTVLENMRRRYASRNV
jgi:hypothetical protein